MFFLAFLLLLTSIVYCAQSEWEYEIPDGLAWKSEPGLTTSSSSLSGLRISNLNSESNENKKNNSFSLLSAYLTQQIVLDRPLEINFTVSNKNSYVAGPQTHITSTKMKVKGGRVVANILQTVLLFPVGIGSWWWNPPKEMVQYGYTDDSPSQVYWGYTIVVKSSTGSRTTFFKRFCHHDGYRVYELCSDDNNWHDAYNSSLGTQELKLVYEKDKTLKFYSGSILLKTFPDAVAITYMSLDAGCNAKLETSSFSFQKMTNFGIVKPMIEEAVSMMQNENWYGASKLLGEIMDTKGYKNFTTHYLKGYCHMSMNNFRTAIDELTKAITSPKTMFYEREAAYYIRGFCKAQLEDVDCINDMRKAGEDGKIWLREMQLEDYYPDKFENQETNQNVVMEKPNPTKSSGRMSKSLKTSQKPPLRK